MNQQHVFYGCIPALMTPCSESGTPDFDALVRKGKERERMSSLTWGEESLSFPSGRKHTRTLTPLLKRGKTFRSYCTSKG